MSAVLNDKSILSLFRGGIKVIDPFEEDSLKSASLDLRLGNIKYSYNLREYVLGQRIDEEDVTKQEFESIPLENGETAFVGIYERITIPNDMIGLVAPRSSITRLGIHIVGNRLAPSPHPAGQRG